MAKITEAVNALFDSANTVAGVVNDYTAKQAELSTRTKNIQLQTDINDELNRIKQSSTADKWNTEINGFFERVKSGMSNPESPYYCRNNLQARQFEAILDQNQVNVSEHVNNLVMQRQREERIVGVQNAKAQLAQMYSGQEYIDKCNELDRGLYEGGDIGPEDYQKQMDVNYLTGYRKMHTDVFDGSFSTALEKGKSAEGFWQDIKNAVPDLKARDIKGLEKILDKTATDENLKKEAYSYYNARLSDIQQGNANTLSEIEQRMRQSNTAEGKLNIALQGQQAMNSMLGLKLSENDRRKYAAVFELTINGGVKGSGSGSGSSKPSESFDELVKVAPGEALELLKNNPELCPYDAAEIYSMRLTKWFMAEDYKENYDKDNQGRAETFDRLYEHSTAKETIADGIFKEIKDKYPTLAGYIDSKAKTLKDYVKKNAKNVSEADLEQVSAWCVDWALSANGNMTDADFKKDFDNMINTFYVSNIKSVTLNDKGNLKQTFNANKAGDIAKAAQIASENDFVFTDQYGAESWAPGKKEALEAEGGIVNVLQNAVAGTLDIPESEYKNIGFYYQPDASGNDKTSKPIITYKDKAYEVIPDEKGKGFSIRDINSGETLEGKTGGKVKAVMRANQKDEAKQTIKESSRDVAKLKKEREEETKQAIKESTSIPKAMQAAGKVDKETWQDYKDEDTRTYNLRVTANKMDSDAKKLSDTEFKNKYNISKDEWTEDKVESRRFNLILKS